jgi:hypothetical protein
MSKQKEGKEEQKKCSNDIYNIDKSYSHSDLPPIIVLPAKLNLQKVELAPIFGPFSKLVLKCRDPYPKTVPAKKLGFWLSNCSANCCGVKSPSELCGRNSGL